MLFVNRFDEKISSVTQTLQKGKIEILQVNMGKYCNMTCSHCHVEAGPTKIEENMDRKTAEAVIRFLERSGIKIVDITGGAPELNLHFDYLVIESRKRNTHVMDRCNLTVFFEKGKEYLPEFLAEQKVEVIASLPCYSRENVDTQRGKGAFDASIEALLWLNKLEYGKEGSGLILNLVYNPVGSHLPPPQDTLEKDYKTRLLEDFGIVFNHLYTITNMPITRYEKYLKAFGQYEKYVALLEKSFNPHTVGGLMCRNTLSVGWDGELYDCDFNQMLSMRLNGHLKAPQPTIFDVTLEELEGRDILTGNHCFGCTAGCGSSCGGAIQTGS